MTFEEFTKMIKKEVLIDFPEYELSEERVEKLQNQSYNGLVLKEKGSSIGMTLNLDMYYRQMEDGKETDEILMDIGEMIASARHNAPLADIDDLKDYAKLKENLIMQMIPAEGNEEMLSKMPHKRIIDLAVVYRVMLSRNGWGEASLLLTNQNCRIFGVSREQVETDALIASEKNHPLTIKSMEAVIFHCTEDEKINETGLWVISNDTGRYGASVIAYPGVLEKIAENVGGSFYVIPSSVHEMLAIPESRDIKAKELDSMVASVNSTEVAEEERLTNHCYHYDNKAKLFETGTDYEARKEREKRI